MQGYSQKLQRCGAIIIIIIISISSILRNPLWCGGADALVTETAVVGFVAVAGGGIGGVGVGAADVVVAVAIMTT